MREEIGYRVPIGGREERGYKMGVRRNERGENKVRIWKMIGEWLW